MRSRREAPTKPWRLNTGAASSTIRWRVRSPLVLAIGLLGRRRCASWRCLLRGSSLDAQRKNRPVGLNRDAGAGGRGQGRVPSAGMCGRYVSVSSPTILAERFHVDEVRTPEAWSRTTTSRPGPTCRWSPNVTGERVLDVVRWGLVPSWAKIARVGDRMINARAETLTTSNAFKRAVRAAALHRPRRRLLRVADDRGPEGRASRGSSAAATASRSRSPGCGRSGTTATLGDDAPRIRIVHDHHDRAERAHARRSTTGCR